MATLNSVGDSLLALLNEVLLYIPKMISAAILLIIGCSIHASTPQTVKYPTGGTTS